MRFLYSSACDKANTFSSAEWILKASSFGFFGGVSIFVTMVFNLSVSLIIISKNFLEKSSLTFDNKICALPLMPERGFLTSCARVLAKFAAIFWVENTFDESIILFKLSTHKISIIKILSALDQLTVKSTILWFSLGLANLKFLFVIVLPELRQSSRRSRSSLLVSGINWFLMSWSSLE